MRVMKTSEIFLKPNNPLQLPKHTKRKYPLNLITKSIMFIFKTNLSIMFHFMILSVKYERRTGGTLFHLPPFLSSSTPIQYPISHPPISISHPSSPVSHLSYMYFVSHFLLSHPPVISHLPLSYLFSHFHLSHILPLLSRLPSPHRPSP